MLHRCATRFAPALAGAALAMLAGCAAVDQGTAPSPPSGSASGGPLGSPFADRPASGLAYPLLLDRNDLSLGTTIQFARMPSLAEISDLAMVTSLRHVVITLPAWPPEYAPLEVLQSLPLETDCVVVLPGYPPSRAASEAWNMVNARLRVVVVVRESPASSGLVADLNNMRSLERVIVETDTPTRTGFERLQRPLSFRVLRE